MAIRAKPSTDTTFTLYDLVDPGGGYVTTGATVTLALVNSAGTTVDSGAATSGGTNDWSAVLTTPSAEGLYTLLATIAYDGATNEQAETVDVRSFLNQGGTTLRDLRRSLARDLGDLKLATATVATATGSTFTDAARLRLSSNQYAGAHALCAVGATGNLGADNARYVSGSDGAGTLSFTPAFTAGFGAGDVLELHSLRGDGWPVDEKHGAINDALRLAAGMGGARLSASLTASFDYDTPTVTVPSAFRKVDKVEYQDDAGEWRRIARARRQGSPGWYAPGDGTLQILGHARSDMDGQTVRLWGFGKHDDLTDDEDATLVLPEWVKWQAGYTLLMAGTAQRDPSRAAMIPDFRQNAALWRRGAVVVQPSDCAVVRHV
jgi:hypothetical protein